MKILITIVILIMFVVFSQTANAHEKCPVSNTELDHSTSVKFNYTGTEYEFCSDKCLAEFKEEPILYMKSALCIPCNDDDANPELTFVHEDVKYYFCNKGCQSKFKSTPEKFLDNLKSKK